MPEEFEFYATPFKINNSTKINIPSIIAKKAKIVHKTKKQEGKIYKFVLKLEED